MDVIDQYTSQDTYISKTDVVAGNIYEKVNKRYIYRAVKRFF